MRLHVLTSVSAIVFIASSLLAAPLDDAERKAVTAAVMERLTVEPERIENDGLARVFDATFYKVDVRLALPSGATKFGTKLMRVGEEVLDVPSPASTQSMPELVKILRKDFLLKSKADAATFEQALDVLYPMGSSDKKHKAIAQKGSRWTFVRGKFFDDTKGYVATTDASGRITEIRRVLKLSELDAAKK